MNERMLRSGAAIAVVIAGTMSAGTARASGGNCPARYDTAVCSNFCVRDAVDPTLVRCDITAQPGDNEIVAVTNYRWIQLQGTAMYSAWGTADGADFCCELTSGPNNPINAFRVLTGDGDDTVWLTAFDSNGNEKNLAGNVAQTVTRFIGSVYPGDGDDYVQGSNTVNDNYRDHLFGENGTDQIFGNKGNDFLSAREMRVFGTQSVDNDGEALYGGAGRDEIVGASNNITDTDTVFVDGGPGADLLCTGPQNELTAYEVFFFGGGGDDQIYSRSSFVAGFDGPIDGEAGTDGCDNPGGGSETSCEAAFNRAAFTPWSPLGCW